MLAIQQLAVAVCGESGVGPSRSSPAADSISLRAIKSQARAQYTNDMRRELLGGRSHLIWVLADSLVLGGSSGGLRLRSAGDALSTENPDIDAVLKHHHGVQEQLAEEFLHLTRNLKENVTVAGHVVRDDTKVQPPLHQQTPLSGYFSACVPAFIRAKCVVGDAC